MVGSQKELAGAIGRYGENYLSLQVQGSADGTADPQLASIITLIAEQIAGTPEGAIIDVGCGSGSFLQRLLDVPAFLSSTGWTYVGVDEESGLAKVQEVARAAKVNRRTELFTLEEFYTSWPDVASLQLIFCRNVLHELGIIDTARLLHHVQSNMASNDRFIIQDLLKFPEAERHNACWEPSRLAACIESFGFTAPVVVVQPTRSGNAYFNMTARLGSDVVYSCDDVLLSVKQERHLQWQSWAQSDTDYRRSTPQRDDAVEAIDFDLQLAALTRQLADVGVLNILPVEVAKRVRADQFTSLIQQAASENLVSSAGPPEVSNFHFRERGSQLTRLEDFLRSDSTFAQIHGGAGYGKTTLANRLLATRAYNKAVVRIDGRVVKTFWSFVESFFAQVNVRLAPEQLSVIDNLNIGNALPVISSYLNAHVANIIVFYDNFDDVVDSRSSVSDKDLASFLEAVVKRPGAKFICGRKAEAVPRELAASCIGLPEVVRVGRYGSDDTVRNVLDDYFDRVAAKVDDYPEALLQAIDRHPLIAALAAKILQRDGQRTLHDSVFINQLKLKLRRELWNRIVDDAARPAVAAAAQLRIPVPPLILQKMASKESISSARESELIHAQADSRWNELLAVLGLFKLREVAADPSAILSDVTLEEEVRSDLSHDQVEDANALNNEIALLYRAAYRLDDDPKWIRESYFHQIMASGGDIHNLPAFVGRYYSDELVASADYYFTRARDYRGALHLYEQAAQIEGLREVAEMRYASCLVRTGDLKEGDKTYSALTIKYPESLGIKTSYIDALIYLRNFEGAQSKLQAFGLKEQSDWVRWQWGRVYGGLDEYDQAIEALRPLVGRPDGDPHFHVHYARALRAFGNFNGSLSAIDAAVRRFPNEVAVTTAAAIEHVEHGLDGAHAQLDELFTANQSNTRAAAALIQIALSKGDVTTAGQILYIARPLSPNSTQVLVAVGEAQILVSKGQVDLALAKLKAASQEPVTYVAILDAMAARERSVRSDPKELASEVAKLQKLRRFSKNVPVQLALARLGHQVGASAIVQTATDALDHTAFPKDSLDKVRSGEFFE